MVHLIEPYNGFGFLQFKNLLTQNPLASQYLMNELTIFAPSDNAMNKYQGPKDDQFILNHMGKLVPNPFEVLPEKCQCRKPRT